MAGKIIVRLVLAAALSGLLYFAWNDYRKDMAELSDLRDYKTSVELRDEVSHAGRNSFEAQRSLSAVQITANQSQREFAASKTNEVAHEDKATADFLSQPIPQRLRDADREARLARGLAASERAPASASSAH